MKSDYDRLAEKVSQLERENELLRQDVEVANGMTILYSQLSEEYKKINRELKESKHAYDKARQEMLLMKAKYKDQMVSLIADIKDTIDTM